MNKKRFKRVIVWKKEPNYGSIFLGVLLGIIFLINFIALSYTSPFKDDLPNMQKLGLFFDLILGTFGCMGGAFFLIGTGLGSKRDEYFEEIGEQK